MSEPEHQKLRIATNTHPHTHLNSAYKQCVEICNTPIACFKTLHIEYIFIGVHVIQLTDTLLENIR